MTLVSTLGQSLDQIERIKQQQVLLGTLQQQISTGKKTQLYKGLDTDTIISKRARANFNKIDLYLNNIARGSTRVKQMTTSLSEIKNQAQNTLNALTGQPQQGDIDLGIIKQIADKAYDFVGQLLNQRDGDTYIFGGADSSTPPIRDTGSLDAFFAGLNPLWTSGTLTINPPNATVTEEYIDQYENMPEVTAGYSGSINNAKNVLIRVDDGVELDYTVLANETGLRDVLTTIGAIKNLPDVQDAPGADAQEKKDNFFQVFNDLAVKLTKAIDDIESIEFRLNSVEVAMAQTEELHKLEKNTLLSTIDDVENIDLAETATKLQILEVQLEASFRVTAAIRDLSLVNFI